MDKEKIYLSNFNTDDSETVAYNDPLFPFYRQNGYMSRFPDYTFITHWHQDLEFVVILEGSMTYSVNGILTELHENEGFMVNSRQVHSCFSSKRSECRFICYLFSMELFQNNSWLFDNYIEPVTHHTDIPFLKFENKGWKKEVVQELRKITEKYTPFDVMEHGYHIMKLLYENLPVFSEETSRQSNDLTALKKMLMFMNENYAEQLTLEDISGAGACCTSKCCSLFRKYLHDTPVKYLTKQRLRKSLENLLKEDVSITEVAMNCGFHSSSYYCELFRRYYEQSPLQYRKEHLENKIQDLE